MGAFDNIKKTLGKSADTIKDSVQNLPTAVKDVNLADSVKELAKKGGGALENWKAKNEEAKKRVGEALHRPTEQGDLVTTADALKIIYCLMAADGQVRDIEEERFDSIGRDMDPHFDEHKEPLLESCRAQIGKALDDEDYYDTVHDCAGDAIRASQGAKNAEIPAKLLLWNLLAVAYSDGDCSEVERRLIRYLTKALDVDKTVLLEMESTIQTVQALEREEEWLKTSQRPYSQVEEQRTRLADRRQTILQGVHALMID